jgi:hypothetical protein
MRHHFRVFAVTALAVLAVGAVVALLFIVNSRPSFRKREFTRFVLSPAKSGALMRVKALGIEPMVVRLDRKSPSSDQRH